MPKLLLIEDSRLFGSVVKRKIQFNTFFSVTWVQTMADAIAAIEETDEKFYLSVLDLNLPDAPNGEMIEVILEHRIPAIVSTASFEEDLRKQIWSKHIVDFVLKESSQGVEYLVGLVNRLWLNQSKSILVVDDFKTSRKYVTRLLKTHYYQVLEAGNGEEALTVFRENPDISLLITDYNMPVMDGFQLVDKIRKTKSREELAIIGMSGQGNDILTARFLKNGANDFIRKPFSSEEFYCRVAQNIAMIEYVRKLRSVEKSAE